MNKYNGMKRASDWVGKTVKLLRDIKEPTFSGYETPKVNKKDSVWVVISVAPDGGLRLSAPDKAKFFGSFRAPYDAVELN
jgi:hypothetical protein